MNDWLYILLSTYPNITITRNKGTVNKIICMIATLQPVWKNIVSCQCVSQASTGSTYGKFFFLRVFALKPHYHRYIVSVKSRGDTVHGVAVSISTKTASSPALDNSLWISYDSEGMGSARICKLFCYHYFPEDM